MEKKELKKLLDDIDKYDDAYYNKNKKLISDEEYDGLKDKIKSQHKAFQPKNKADEKLAIRLNDAATRVGAPPPLDGKWPKYNHEVPMGSLDKVNLPSELTDWNKKTGSAKELFVTEKLDGISIGLKYVDGVLHSGATRGDGNEGEDITRNVRKMFGVPTKIDNTFTGYIRGEIVLLHSNWKKYLPEMDNPRNGASGVAKRINGVGSEYLTVMSYTIEGRDFDTEVKAIEALKALGFKIPNYSVGTLEDANKMWQKYMDKTRKELDYDIDGLVVRINDKAKQFALGETNGKPHGARAFKFEAPQARTKLNDIVCQVGDTGQITPVAEFDEVELLGAKVKRASLHNFALVKELGANVGAEIMVERANDVIPYVKSVTKKNGPYFKPPTKCPACGGKVKWGGDDGEGKHLQCTNKKDCPPQVIGRINKWIKELGILEWGESILTKLIDAGKVSDVADIYELTSGDISSLDRMGQKSADNLIAELDKFREVTLENFLGGLCIDGIATSTSKSIIDEGHDTLDKILALSTNELEDIPGFAAKRAKAFHDGLIENADRIERILEAGVTIKDRVKGSMTGSTFCFTGSMNTPRAKLQKMVEENGGEVKKSVGKGLKYLVIADPNSTSSKAKAARKNNTTLISEEEFLDMAKKK